MAGIELNAAAGRRHSHFFRFLVALLAAPLWILMSSWVWCIGIVYSTMTTGQHVVVDVLAGLALGTLGACLSLRQHKDADAAGTFRRQPV